MLSSSDCESQTVAELLALEPDARERLLDLRLGYTEVPGSARAARARSPPATSASAPGTCSRWRPRRRGSSSLTTRCWAPASTRCRDAVLRLGARARAQHGRRGERVAAPLRGRLGARPGGARSACCAPDTRLIYINSPHNPTGTQMPADGVRAGRSSSLAERSLVLFSDEVYRGLEHDPAERLPAACDVYERAISLNTVSKAHGLPGLRIGWLAAPRPRAARPRQAT